MAATFSTAKASAKELPTTSPGAIHVEIPAAGHDPNIEEPVAFNREVIHFLHDTVG